MANLVPGVTFSLLSLANFESEAFARRLIERFIATSPILRPRKFGAFEPAKESLTNSSFGKAIHILLNSGANAMNQVQFGCRRGSLVLSSPSAVSGYQINWERAVDPSFSLVGGDLAHSTIESSPESLVELVRLFCDLAEITEAVYGEVRNMAVKHWDLPFDLKIRLPDVPWIALFGRPYLEMFGRDRVLSVPAFSTRECGSSHVLVQSTPSVMEPINDAVKDAIRTYLGADAFMAGNRWRYKDGTAPQFDYSNVVLSG